MSGKKALGSPLFIPEVGVLQRNLLSPASDPVDILPIQTSRKRKHAETDHGNGFGEPFFIQVLTYYVFLRRTLTNICFGGTPFASILRSPAIDAQAFTSSIVSTTSLSRPNWGLQGRSWLDIVLCAHRGPGIKTPRGSPSPAYGPDRAIYQRL